MPPADEDFSGRVFDAGADFSGRTFEGAARFHGCVFEDRADFGRCVFKSRPDFGGAVFKGRAYFTGAVFEAGAGFHETVFEKFVNFDGVRVTGEAHFNGAQVQDGWTLESAVVEGALSLRRVNLDRTSRIGPVTATSVDLTLVAFPRRVRLEFDAEQIVCERSMFHGGVQFLLGAADLRLEDCELGPASQLGTRPAYTGPPPRLVTVSGTDMSNLTVSRADLSACKLVHALNLDLLRIESDDAFGWTPRSMWITRRRITGDERRWRALHSRPAFRERWRPPDSWPDRLPPDTAAKAAEGYRALRKGREDARDEPGAADFYYGEMEMRRLGKWAEIREHRRAGHRRGLLAARGEHALLWLYWAVSGYGLRAWRAFAALAAVLALAAAGLLAWGFPPEAQPNYADSLRFSLRAAISLLRGPEQKLTTTGEWIELALRLLGPLLFGLAVLALRGRVKR